jgi:hypothetical protein
MITLKPRTAALIILAVRFSLGPLSLFLPKLTTRLMLMNSQDNPASAYLVRLFGIRDLYLGVLAVTVPKPSYYKVIGISSAIDLVDATAATVAGAKGEIPVKASVLAAISGLLGACLGLAAVGRGPLARKSEHGQE